jgi:hypothetical protein
MAETIEIRELRRHEVGRAVEFAGPLGCELAAGAVRWTASLTARRGDAWLGVVLVGADGGGTPRAWVAVDASLGAKREALVGRLLDKAAFKLRAHAWASCAVTVCGDESNLVERAIWSPAGEAGSGREAGAAAPMRSLDEVLADGRRDGGTSQGGADEMGERERERECEAVGESAEAGKAA